MKNGKGGRSPVSWRDLRPLGDSCARPELPRRDADEALEMTGTGLVAGGLRRRSFAGRGPPAGAGSARESLVVRRAADQFVHRLGGVEHLRRGLAATDRERAVEQ